MSLYKQFKTDNDLEKSGIVLEYGENSHGKPIGIRIGRAGGGNLAYQRLLEARVKPYRRQIQNETIENALVEKLMREVYAETVVIGWENVEFPVLDAAGNDTGKTEELPYTVENCVRLFNDLPELYRDIQEQSQRAALFRAEVREADSKN